jgi:potassium efflux system protein
VAVERLERLLRDNRTRLGELRAEETSLQETAGNLQVRIEAARQELKAATAAAAPGEKAPVAVAGESGAMTQARMDQWLVGKELRASLITRLEAEVHTVPDRLRAVQAELKLVVAQREQTERFLAELLSIDNLKRIGEAEKLRDELRARLAEPGSTHPGIVALRQEILALADEYVEVVAHAEAVGADVAAAQRELAEVTADYDSIRQQLEIAALSDALGPVLMEQYPKLKGLQHPERDLNAIADRLSRTRLREFQVARMQAEEVQVRENVYRLLETDAALAEADRAAAFAEADRLLTARNRLLDALGRTYVDSTGQIVDLEEAYRAQGELAAKFRSLLDRNLIWMKSHPPLGVGDFLHWPAATLRLIVTPDWRSFGVELREQVLAHPVSLLLSLLVLLVVLRYRNLLQARLAQHSLRRAGWRNYRYRMGLEALGIHLLVALPVPLLLLCAGWLLSRMPGDNPLAPALAGAAYQTAVLSYLYLVILEAMGPEGFARGHLRWKAARVHSVERLMRIGVWIMLPLSFLSATLGFMSAAAATDESYRISGLVVTAIFLAFLLLIVRAARGMFDSAFYSRSYPLLSRIGELLVYAVILSQPLVVLLDLAGYHFTAIELQVRVFLSSVVLVLSKMMLDAGLLGLTIAAQRTLDAAQAEAEAEAAAEEPAAAGEQAPVRPVADLFEEFDVEKMNKSAIALLQVFVAGLAAAVIMVIWQQFFTALSILDSVTLWTYAETVEGKESVATVSAFDLGGALLVLLLGLVLASGLPSLIGIVFYRFITEKGVLYAIQTVIRYVVAVLAVMVSLQMLGFGWSKLQWMAAGLSVGLGFGLQAIFANFFSGLIMLFERPVRIGDVITLGEFSGTIQRIRMRATTILDFDNREIIVPNQMFVTERLINWTLTDSVVRMSFDVGVSYDADPRAVRQTLLDILESDPRVLKDPPPNVVFREFGASSLNMRCFGHVEDVSVRFQVQNDLHMRITEVFREKGIEIAYPQMDLHLRSVDEGARMRL